MAKEKECLEWNVDGTCATWRVRNDGKPELDITACDPKMKQKITDRLRKGIVLKDTLTEEQTPNQ